MIVYKEACQIAIVSLINCFEPLSLYLISNGYVIKPVPNIGGGVWSIVDKGKVSTLIFFEIVFGRTSNISKKYEEIFKLINDWYKNNNYSYIFIHMSTGTTFYDFESIRVQTV